MVHIARDKGVFKLLSYVVTVFIRWELLLHIDGLHLRGRKIGKVAYGITGKRRVSRMVRRLSIGMQLFVRDVKRLG